MSTVPPQDRASGKNQRTEEDNNRTAGAVVGGAILGGSLAGPIGALLGGLIGSLLSEKVNEGKRKDQ